MSDVETYRPPKQHTPPPAWLTRAVSWLLRSRWHTILGLSNETTVLNVRGRKSGKVYSVPVTYYQEPGAVYVTTTASWSKNLLGGADLTLWLRGRLVSARADIVSDPPVLARAIEHWIRLRPKLYADLFHVRLDGREPVAEDVQAAAAGARGLIRIAVPR
jgi:hypothetical protein